MKRYDTPPLGSNYGATVRMEGPHAPIAVFRPAPELERIRNPFLPPEVTPQEVVEAEFENSDGEGEGEGRESDVWSNDASSSRRVPATPTSGRMIVGSLLVFAMLGAGAFAALYSAVHSDDGANRARYDANESQVMMAPANANAIPATPMDPATAPAPSSAAPETVSAAAQVDSGALAAPARAGATTAPAAAPIRPARVVAAPAQAAAPPKYESAHARKAPIVVHVEPAPVPFHRAIEDKDVPVSEDALLAGSAQAAQGAPPSPTAPSPVAPATSAPSAPATSAPSAPATSAPSAPATSAPSAPATSAKADLVPPGNDDPDDPRK